MSALRAFESCDGDKSAFSDVLDTELSQACDVLLGRSDGLAHLNSTSTNDAAASDVEYTSGAGCVQITLKFDLSGACNNRK